MDTATPPAATVSTVSQSDTTKKHLRGSSLLLVGRFLSVGLDFATHVLIVRYLSKSDYGAFAYALAMVSLCSSLAVFGMDKSIARFVPIYQEQRDYNKLFGTIILMVSTIVAIGITITLFFYGAQGWIAQSLIVDPQARALLLILIIFSLVHALNSLLGSMFAIFANPRMIFFRRHVLGPGLTLSVVLLVILWQYDVFVLAVGWMVAGTLNVLINTIVLVRVMRAQGLFQHFNPRTLKLGAREIFGFTTPLLTTDLVFVLRTSLVVMLLEYFHSTTDVAAFRAVLPIARQNMLVYQTFTALFMPLAARLFARNDREGISNLYWQSAIWMAVISFPIFVTTFSLAEPLTVTLYGQHYADAGMILALLSFGHYVNAALGFNGLTLRVFGKVRYIFIVDFLGALISIGVSLVLIPYFGALGAAIGTCATMVLQNICYQAGLYFGTGVAVFKWSYLKVYLSIALGGFGLLLVQVLASPPVYVGFTLAALVSLLVFGINRRALNIGQTFPEVLRIPLARRLFGG